MKTSHNRIDSISETDMVRINNWTAKIDINTNEVVDTYKWTKEETNKGKSAMKIVDKEARIKEAEALILRKLALEELEEEDDTGEKLQSLKATKI